MAAQDFTRCPLCGQKTKLNRTNQKYTKKTVHHKRTSFAHVAASPLNDVHVPPEFSTYEKRIPARAPTLHADVFVPLAQSGIWAAVLSLPTVMLSSFGAPWYTPFVSFAVLMPVCWGIASGEVRRGLWIIEEITSQDFDGDGAVGKPDPIPLEMVVKNEKGTFLRMFNQDLPSSVSEAEFLDWAQAVVSGVKSLAISNWTGRGKPFSRESYEGLLDCMTGLGVVAWVDNSNRAAGRRLTPNGKQTLEWYIRRAQMAQN